MKSLWFLAAALALMHCGAPKAVDAETARYRRLTDEVTDFGGVRLSDSGRTVFVLGGANLDSAQRQVAAVFFGTSSPEVQVRAAQGQASADTKEKARDVLQLPHVSFVSFEGNLRYVRIAITEVGALGPVQTKLGELGVSLDDVVVQVSQPISAQ